VIITAWPSLVDTAGKERDLTWERLAAWMAAPVEFRGKDTPGWSAAAFIGPSRRSDRCTAVHGLVLDFDDGKAPRSVIETLFAGHRALAHTSKSHTAENQSYRVVLDLTRPVLPAEYAILWSAVTRDYADRVDQAAKDCSRFWFVPCRTEATEYESFGFDGDPIDVDAVLEAERERARKIAADIESRRMATRQPAGRMSVVDRASRYVSRMDASIAGSGGHKALWAATLALVKGFALPTAEAGAILASEFNPRCQPAWSKREIDHKLDNAEKANSESGYLLGDAPNYEYQAFRPVIPREPEPEEPFTLADPDGIPVEDEPESAPPEDAPVVPPTIFETLGIVTIQSLCLDVLTDIDKPRSKSTCRTGIAEIDAAIGGYRGGMVTVMGAATNFGKTRFSLMSADIAAKADKLVIYCTLEDSPLLYGRSIVARRGHINATRLRDGEVTYDERRRILTVAQEAQKEPFMLNCIGKPAEWIAKALTDVSNERHIDLVIVDYIQRARAERRTQDRRTEMTFAVEILSNTIKNIGAAGLLLSQLKRLENGSRPTKSDLKESGDIENMAEHIILGYTKDNGNGGVDRMLYLDKNKDGPVITADIPLRFDDVSASFISSDSFDGETQRDVDDVCDAIGGDRFD
jgi:hypothetical protein